MTLRDFDPGVIGNYTERKYLLHFQWNDGTEKICRYALVETFNSSEIDSRSKQKKDEIGLTQKELAQRCNFNVQIVNDIETGKAIYNHIHINKIKRVLKMK